MNEPFRIASQSYEQHGADFPATLAFCHAYGEVHGTQDYFIMGYWASPRVFFVTMLAGDFRKCAADHAGRCDAIQFAREFKGSKRIRQISIKRLLNHG